MNIKISLSNRKLGDQIPSINLPAGGTCRKDAPCLKGCYALKGNYLFESVQNVYKNNLKIYKETPDLYFNEIIDFLNNGDALYRFFRWHASGDIVDYNYLLGIVRVAEETPLTKFLCYTKKFEMVNLYLKNGGKIPSNLNIVFSGWDKKFDIKNTYNLPTTILNFKNNLRNATTKNKTYQCNSDCKTCKMCWNIKSGETVVFNQH